MRRTLRKTPKNFGSIFLTLDQKDLPFKPNVNHKGKNHSGVAAAEAFAEYFTSVFRTEVPKLDLESIVNPSNCNISYYINILSFAECDISTAINKIKINSAIGPDNIPPWFLKEGHEFLIRPLNHISNSPLKSRIYSPQWKVLRVTPITKFSNKSSVEEYRPIAILPSPAKVFGNVLHEAIYKQVKQYLCNELHGFREKRSVDTNLLSLVNYIIC